MNERDATLLHDYFNGLLNSDEAQRVRERVIAEPEFGQEFFLREAMETFPQRQAQRQAFTDTLVAVEKDFFQENAAEKTQTPPMTAKVHWKRWMAAAASLALLAAAYWFFNQPSLPEYRQFALHSPLALTLRGVNDQEKSNAEKAFSQQDYSGCLAALDQVLNNSASSGDLTAQLYKGICLLELDRAADARAVWAPMATGQSALRSEAQWYIALSYLKEKNYAACKTALQTIQSGEDRYQDAQKLLLKLPE